MIDFPYLSDICRQTDSKIVMLVVDGLGGLPDPATGKSELETADIPNLDALARQSNCGLTTPVLPGITPGSGPGHMSLFGYDPVKYLMGRGVLEALGSGVRLAEGDVAARGNLCTVAADGTIADRRAGRLPTSESVPLLQRLNGIELPGADVEVHPVRDHRFVLALRGAGLDERVTDTDPLAEGTEPLAARPLAEAAAGTADLVNEFVEWAGGELAGRSAANMVVLRGLSGLPDLPSMADAYALRPAVIAGYPMYRGLAELIGMTVLDSGSSFDEQLDVLETQFDAFDYFFLHYKPADAAGEDGNFEAKVASLEALDGWIPRVLDLEPDALVVCGDHSTPAVMAGHSWHPVPLMIRSPYTPERSVEAFTEMACDYGALGRIPAVNLMLLVLAHAGKLAKFGP